MRLLDTITGQFVEKDPRDVEITYAILSHTWDHEGEQAYPALAEIQSRYAPRYQPLNNHHPPSKTEPLPSALHPQQSSISRSLPAPPRSPPQPLPNSRSSSVSRGARKRLTYLSSVPSETPLSVIWNDRDLSPKIREACKVAREDGYRYIWIDSCCIDKTSSSELSEAINSMYEWYTYAHICYAFLADVPTTEDHRATDSRFRRSRWFTRGWTLQELIAPLHVVFLSEDWKAIGSKLSLASLVTDITNISYDALLQLEPLQTFSVAQRLSWASRRKTTRVEDQAYSLLGLFDIHMPTIYGEGERALRRLQEEIMRRIPDQSLFAWTYFHSDSRDLRLMDLTASQHHSRRFICETSHPYLISKTSLLAPSLHMFRNTGRIVVVSHDEVVRRLQCSPHLPPADYSFTSHGVRTQLPVIPLSTYFPPGVITVNRLFEMPLSQWYLVILGCEHEDLPGRLLGRICYVPFPGSNVELLYVGHVSASGAVRASSAQVGLDHLDLLPLSSTTVTRLRRQLLYCETVYISYPIRQTHNPRELAAMQPHETINLVLQKKMRSSLLAQGYTADLRGPDPDVSPASHCLTLAHSTHTITIEYEHILEREGEFLLITAGVAISESEPLPSWVLFTGKELRVRSAPHPQGQVDSSTVFFTSSMPWPLTLGRKEVVLKLSDPWAQRRTLATTRIGLELELVTKDHYAIQVDALPYEPTSTTVTRPRRWKRWLQGWTQLVDGRKIGSGIGPR